MSEWTSPTAVLIDDQVGVISQESFQQRQEFQPQPRTGVPATAKDRSFSYSHDSVANGCCVVQDCSLHTKTAGGSHPVPGTPMRGPAPQRGDETPADGTPAAVAADASGQAPLLVPGVYDAPLAGTMEFQLSEANVVLFDKMYDEAYSSDEYGTAAIKKETQEELDLMNERYGCDPPDDRRYHKQAETNKSTDVASNEGTNGSQESHANSGGSPKKRFRRMKAFVQETFF